MKELMIAPSGKKTIGIPMAKAVWTSSEPSYKDVTRLTITCGGGMGGSMWYEYVIRGCTDTEQYGGVSMIVCTRVNGEHVTINPSYIVAAEDFSLVQATYENHNSYYKPGRYTISMLVRGGQKLSLVSTLEHYDGSRDNLYALSEEPSPNS